MSSGAGPSSFLFRALRRLSWAPRSGTRYIVALAGGTGSTVGEIAAYLAGLGSYDVVRKIAGRNRWYVKWYGRIRGWIEARGMITIFLFAATPNPFFDLAGFAAGSMRYPISRFVVACWLGKMVKYAVVTYAAFWGADMIYGWFEGWFE